MVFSKQVKAFVCLLAFEVATAQVTADSTYHVANQTTHHKQVQNSNLHRSLMFKPLHPHAPEKPVAPEAGVAATGAVGATGAAGVHATGATGATGAAAGHAAQPAHPAAATGACSPSKRVVNGKTVESVNCNTVIFVQKWMPTEKYAAGKADCVECIPAIEAEDWDNHLMAAGLRPTHPVKGSVASVKFPLAARKAIIDKEWRVFKRFEPNPNKRPKVEMDPHEEEWATHGVHTGLNAVEYVKEVMRLQKLEKTPKEFLFTGKGNDNGKDKTIAKAQLKALFPQSCVKCDTIKGKQYFDTVEHCYNADPKTHHATTQVKYDAQHCKPCVETCTQPNIIIPHVVVA